MESYEALKNAISGVGAKKVARDLRVSTSLVYKWGQPSKTDEDPSGARNPLDRVMAIYRSTGSDLLLEWLCSRAGGFFVPNPEVRREPLDADFFERTQKMVREFGELLRAFSEAMADDSRVDEKESVRIRLGWQTLKEHGEEFVTACEQGIFNR